MGDDNLDQHPAVLKAERRLSIYSAAAAARWAEYRATDTINPDRHRRRRIAESATARRDRAELAYLRLTGRGEEIAA